MLTENLNDIERESKEPIQTTPKTVIIRYATAGRRPPIVELRSPEFSSESAYLYVDTGSEITLLKENCIDLNKLTIDRSQIITIKGVTSGECFTLGTAYITMNNLVCKVHIVPSDFSIETDGLLGWETLEKHKGKIITDEKCLQFPGIEIPFTKDEHFIIPPRTKQVIYARISNPEVDVGHVELQQLGKGLYFGNFIGTNRDGKTYAVILNTTTEEVKINPPEVTLHPCETTQVRGDIFEENFNEPIIDEENDQFFNLSEKDKPEKDRATLVFELLNPETLKHLNDEEIQHIKELIRENPYLFNLPGEKLKATHLVTHKIELTSDIPIKSKRFRNPPIVKQETQNLIDDLLEKEIIRPSTSPYASPTWCVQKKPEPGKKPKWRLVTDFRQLNEVTVGNSYPIPQQVDIIDAVATAKYITCLDLTSGYYQVKMHEEHSRYTAITSTLECH